MLRTSYIGRATTIAPVLVYLCRHAEAEPGDLDEERELTAGGRDQARELAAQLSALPEPPRIVLASPLVRARQTAEAIAEACGAEVRVEPELAPGASAEGLRRAVECLSGPVATVGHQPDCSEIALAETGADPCFGPASMTVLELDT